MLKIRFNEIHEIEEGDLMTVSLIGFPLSEHVVSHVDFDLHLSLFLELSWHSNFEHFDDALGLHLLPDDLIDLLPHSDFMRLV